MSNDTREALAAAAEAAREAARHHVGEVRERYLTLADQLAALTEQPAAHRPVAHFLNNAADGEPPHYAQVAAEYIGTKGVFPLYAHPAAAPQAEPLTDEQIDRINCEMWASCPLDLPQGRMFARAIERAHGIGAAPAAPQAEEEEEERHCMNCAEFGECRPNNLHGCGYEPPAAPAQEPQPEDRAAKHERMMAIARGVMAEHREVLVALKGEAAQEPQQPARATRMPPASSTASDEWEA